MACNYRNVSLLGCSVLALMVAAPSVSLAGGFAVREMSSYGQGSSYAGVAAGGSLSTMFWNPATMTQQPGIQSELVATGILPHSVNTPGAGSALTALGLGGTGNTADDAFVPSGYLSWQFRPDMWLGLSVNSPFGLSVSFPDLWAGRDYAANDSSLRTYNFTPTFAYRLNDMISIGVGVQIQRGTATLNKGITAAGPLLSDFTLSGDGWGYGFTAGVTVTPTPTTEIGLGYRSAINQKIDGSMSVTGLLGALSTNGPVHTTLKLPDEVSLGVRQRVSPQVTLLGTVEWTNWSRIGTSDVLLPSGAPASVAGTAVDLPFQFRDGWFFSVGAEYQWSPQLALRGGVGYEISPITDQVRIPLLPDNNRTWLSVGATYKVSSALSFDFAYSHLFVRNTPIGITATSGNPWFDGVSYVGNVSSHIDIVSVALKYRWDSEPPAAKRMLYTK